MNKHKSNSFHNSEPQSCEVENASLKMRNLLLEDAITKLSRNPQEQRHTRNLSVYSTKSQMTDIPPLPQTSNAELLAKLYNSNRALECNIMKVNSVSEELKIKEEELLNARVELRTHKKGFIDLKELVVALKKQNKKLSEHQDDHSMKYLQNKLSQTLQYNEQLFSDYQKILRQNQSHQCQILQQQEEINQLRESLKDNEVALQKALSKAENKVQHLEQDLDRLEIKQNQSIPELNKKVKALHCNQQQNFDILECCTEYVSAQLINSIQTLKRQLQSSYPQRHFNNRILQFRGLQELVIMNNDKSVNHLVQKMDISQLLQLWTENILSFLIIYLGDHVVQPILEKIYHTERRLHKMQEMTFKLMRKLSENKTQKFKKQSANSSFVNYSTVAQSQIGQSVRKSSFIFEKENQTHNKQNFSFFEDIFEKKLIDLLEVSLSKLSQNQEGLQKSFKKFKKLLQNPQNMQEESKKLYDLIGQQAQNNDLLTMYLKKEVASLKQDFSTFMRSSRSAQLPKMI